MLPGVRRIELLAAPNRRRRAPIFDAILLDADCRVMLRRALFLAGIAVTVPLRAPDCRTQSARISFSISGVQG
ncbi:MAG TPA: hypothetical protein VF859_04920 [Burkholderiales bacterium]